MCNIKRIGMIFLLVFYMCPLQSISAEDTFFEKQPYILYNDTDGYIDQYYSIDKPIEPGIYTQWLTALMIIENTRHFDKEFTVGLSDSNSEYAYGFLPGEKINVQDALFAILFCNSGDMAKACARHMAGREDEFIRLMNKKAKYLGMKNTNFVNVSGDLDPRQKTTLSDLLILVKEVMDNKVFQEVMSKDTYTFVTNKREYRIENNSKHKLKQGIDCFVVPLSENIYSAVSIFKYHQNKYITIGLGDKVEECITFTEKLYSQMETMYKQLVPLEKNSEIAQSSLGIIYHKSFPVILPSDIILTVHKSIEFNDLTYDFIPKHNAFLILPKQTIGIVDIYEGNQKIKSVTVLSEHFYVSVELYVIIGIVIMLCFSYFIRKRRQ